MTNIQAHTCRPTHMRHSYMPAHLNLFQAPQPEGAPTIPGLLTLPLCLPLSPSVSLRLLPSPSVSFRLSRSLDCPRERAASVFGCALEPASTSLPWASVSSALTARGRRQSAATLSLAPPALTSCVSELASPAPVSVCHWQCCGVCRCFLHHRTACLIGQHSVECHTHPARDHTTTTSFRVTNCCSSEGAVPQSIGIRAEVRRGEQSRKAPRRERPSRTSH